MTKEKGGMVVEFGVERDPSMLIKALQNVQSEKGYIPLEDALKVSEYLGVPLTTVYGVATFYELFKLEPRGKHIIRVCQGTACHVKGGKAIVDFLRDYLKLDGKETTDDGMFTLERVACLGACAMAPVVEIDGKVYGKMTPEKVKEIVDKLRGESDEG